MISFGAAFEWQLAGPLALCDLLHDRLSIPKVPFPPLGAPGSVSDSVLQWVTQSGTHGRFYRSRESDLTPPRDVLANGYAIYSPLPPSCASAGSERSSKPSNGGGGPISDALHVRLQSGANWLTPSGVAAKRRQIEAKGLPDMRGRRFLTLSLSPKKFGYDPNVAYQRGNDHMRRFLEAGRLAGLWDRGAWWAWKLEFHKNGWAHWHLILDRTKKFTLGDMLLIAEIWGLGRTNCRRISNSAFGYHFKYAFKGVFQEDSEGSGLCVPAWFMDHYVLREVSTRWIDSDGNTHKDRVQKPYTYSRARFWQTSKGFYTGEKPPKRDSTEPKVGYVVRPVGEVLDLRLRTVVMIARDRSGRYRVAASITLSTSVSSLLRGHCWDSDHGCGATLGARSFCMQPSTINKHIENTQKWKLKSLLSRNSLTQKRAYQLRAERVDLAKC